MNILVGCECSQIVTLAFRNKGHNAYSCDIKASYGGYPEYHIQSDIFKVIEGGNIILENGQTININKWDMLIAHPPCTYLSFAGNRHINAPGRKEKRKEAAEFFLALCNCKIEKKCIENPVGYMNVTYRSPDQIVHPYYFSKDIGDIDDNFKKTCFWLFNLSPLPYFLHHVPPEPKYTYINKNGIKKNVYFTESISKNRQEVRSQTFPGIADAMSKYWG